MTEDIVAQPIEVQRARARINITSARTYFERARTMLRRARTDADVATARGFLTNASDEIARWQAALEACED